MKKQKMKNLKSGHEPGLVCEIIGEDGEIVCYGHITKVCQILPVEMIDYPQKEDIIELKDKDLVFHHFWARFMPHWAGEGHYRLYKRKCRYTFPVTEIMEKPKIIPAKKCCLYCESGDEVEGTQIRCLKYHANYDLEHRCKKGFKPNQTYLLEQAKQAIWKTKQKLVQDEEIDEDKGEPN